MSGFARTREVLALWTEAMSPGAQLCVWHRGEIVLDVSLGDDGLGRLLSPDTLLRVYCSVKPVLALAVARAAEAGDLDLDAPLQRLLPDMRLLHDVRLTARTLLNHTAGLHEPTALAMELLPAAQRRPHVERLAERRAWRVGRDAAYSEWLAWNLLGWALEALVGRPLPIWLRETLLDPLGLHDTWIGMSATQWEAIRDRIGVNCGLHTGRALPMLGERIERMARECNPAYGGYTNARDLARLYARLLERLTGAGCDALPGRDTLAAFCMTSRKAVWDVGLRRECAYGLGFMTDLKGHHFSDACSGFAFGHSGNVGSSFAFADPEHALAVAAIFNGVCDEETSFLRRPALVRTLYEELAAA